MSIIHTVAVYLYIFYAHVSKYELVPVHFHYTTLYYSLCHLTLSVYNAINACPGPALIYLQACIHLGYQYEYWTIASANQFMFSVQTIYTAKADGSSHTYYSVLLDDATGLEYFDCCIQWTLCISVKPLSSPCHIHNPDAPTNHNFRFYRMQLF